MRSDLCILSSFARLGVALAIANTAQAQTLNQPHHSIEEVVVTGHANKTVANTALPVSVLSNEQLEERLNANLGDTLQSMPGVQSSSFGNGVGRPVIRGQTGNRVKVLSGSLAVIDASSVSPDHANAVSPLGAERVEVIRGPATLLYGNGAVGGVVNVLDNRIPDEAIDETNLVLRQSHNTNNDQNTTSALLEQGFGSWQLHLDGYTYDNNEVEIPGLAIIEQPHADEAAEEHDEHNTDGHIGNSDGDGDNVTVGGSYVADLWYAGLAVTQTNKNYGLPPGTHDHQEDPLAGDDEPEAEVNVRIDMEQTRYEFKAGGELSGVVSAVEAKLAYTDYQHAEIEGGGHAEDTAGGAEEEHHGTVYSNQGYDSRLTFTQGAIAGWSGIFGLQLQDREFGGAGEEAYIAPTDITNNAVFIVESTDRGAWTYELGARLESNKTQLSSRCDQRETTVSGSASALRQLGSDSNTWVSLSYSQRSPSEEELYSNVSSETCSNYAAEDQIEHIATGRVELGDPNLDIETSQNLELGWRKYGGDWLAEVNVYYNQISDYIYAAFTDDEEVVAYAQQDAEFYGAEGQITHHLWNVGDSHLDLTLNGDLVRATLDDGDNVPRLAPARVGVTLAWVAPLWSAELSTMEVMKQSHTAESETETDGYTLVDAYLDYHFQPDHSGLLVYVKGNNLLDEDIRDHTSFIKNVAPAAGRGFDLGVRWSF